MVVFILFSILIGALILILLQLERSSRTGPTSNQIQENLQKDAQTKRIDAMMQRWKEEMYEEEKKKVARREYLESNEVLTSEEREERENMRAIEIHNKEMEAIRRGDIPYYIHVNVFSETLKQKDANIRSNSKFPDMPSSLGLNLKEKNPSTRHWNLEMELRARAPIGSIFEWMSCGVPSQPDHIVSFVLIRVNDVHRWHHLTITREKGESLEDILAGYVNTLNKNIFHGNDLPTKIDPYNDVRFRWIICNPETRSWNIRQ
jgi:hypothetical protein